VSRDIAPNYIALDPGEGIDVNAEIQWLTDHFLSDEYVGVLIFHDYGRSAGYALWPMTDRLDTA